MRNEIFDSILAIGKAYARAIDNDETAETQGNLLKAWKYLFKQEVEDKNLHTEYRNYCEWLSATGRC